MKRKIQLIKIILNQEQAVNVSFLASKLNVSNKTIRNDLIEVSEILKKRGIQLIKKPGVGVQAQGDRTLINNLLVSLTVDDKSVDSPKQRQENILQNLFKENRPLLIKELALDFYVSRATINADLNELGRELKKYDLKISYTKGQGIELQGTEGNKRKALAKLFPTNPSIGDYPDYLGGTLLNSDFLTKFKDIIQLDYSKIIEVLKKAESALGFEFTFEAQMNLAIHLAIAIRRILQGNEIELSEELLKSLEQNKEIDVAELIVNEINQSFEVELSSHEKYYILLHILSAKRTHENIDSLPFRLNTNNQTMVSFIKRFIQNIQVELQIFLEADDTLFNYLLLHLNPTISRLRFGLAVENPLFEDIIKNYSLEYEAVEHQKDLFKEVFGLDLPSHEIAYLVLHVAAARERNIKPINVVVLCASGIGTSQFLVTKLRRRFANLNIVDVISNIDLRRFEGKDIDLVISTIQVSTTLPIVVVNPILEESDLSNLRQFLDHKHPKQNTTFEFSVEGIHLGVSLQSKKEILEYLNNQLLANKYVTSEYLESLWERESIGSTLVAPQLAIPHGKFDAVIKSCIQIIVLKEPVEWNKNEYVKVVINVVATRADSGVFINLFKNLAYRIDDPEFMDKLINAEDRMTLKELVQKELLYEHQ